MLKKIVEALTKFRSQELLPDESLFDQVYIDDGYNPVVISTNIRFLHIFFISYIHIFCFVQVQHCYRDFQANWKSKREDKKSNGRRYERFRSKRFVCDFCERSFTLKHNVQVVQRSESSFFLQKTKNVQNVAFQVHIFTYHLGKNPTQLMRGRRFRCKKCNEVSFIFIFLFQWFLYCVIRSGCVKNNDRNEKEAVWNPSCDCWMLRGRGPDLSNSSQIYTFHSSM